MPLLSTYLFQAYLRFVVIQTRPITCIPIIYAIDKTSTVRNDILAYTYIYTSHFSFLCYTLVSYPIKNQTLFNKLYAFHFLFARKIW